MIFNYCFSQFRRRVSVHGVTVHSPTRLSCEFLPMISSVASVRVGVLKNACRLGVGLRKKHGVTDDFDRRAFVMVEKNEAEN